MMNFVADAVERFDIMERERADDDVELVGREIDVLCPSLLLSLSRPRAARQNGGLQSPKPSADPVFEI